LSWRLQNHRPGKKLDYARRSAKPGALGSMARQNDADRQNTPEAIRARFDFDIFNP
jgi:hypothetical protein